MRTYNIKTHAIARWKERVGTEVTKRYIEQLFKNNIVTVIEPARNGRLIVEVKGFVFVISKTNSRTIVHTVYGRECDYITKRPKATKENYDNEVSLNRWRKHQFIGKVRKGGSI